MTDILQQQQVNLEQLGKIVHKAAMAADLTCELPMKELVKAARATMSSGYLAHGMSMASRGVCALMENMSLPDPLFVTTAFAVTRYATTRNKPEATQPATAAQVAQAKSQAEHASDALKDVQTDMYRMKTTLQTALTAPAAIADHGKHEEQEDKLRKAVASLC